MTNNSPENAWNAERDKLVQSWLAAKDALASAKELEMELRKSVQTMLFPNPHTGTQRYELGNGYNVKYVHKINYTLGNKDAVDPDTGNKISIPDQVETIMSEIEKCGNEGAFLVDRLVKTKYELSVTEYKQLDNSSPIKKLIDSILITKDAAPELELEVPK